MTGKLVSVTQTAVPASMTVYAADGKVLQNVAIKPLADDESNTPGSGTTPSTATPSKKGAASAFAPHVGGVLVASLFAVLLAR